MDPEMRGEAISVVDFVAKGPSPGEWMMVLVEEGPWSGVIDDQLRRLQDRLYGCVEAVLHGQLAARFPDSKGQRIIVRLDCYNVPRHEVEGFFQRFSSILSIEDYRRALEQGAFAQGIGFEINFDRNC